GAGASVTPEEQARFEALERRVEELERRMSAPPPQPARIRFQMPTAAASAAAPVAAPRPATPPPPQLETGVGVNGISRIAVVTVVLALAFFFEYAFENHWITPSARVLLGIGCGAAALAFGERLWRAGQRTYGQSLAAAGIAFLYLSFWAAFELYHLVPLPAGFTLMVLATALARYLALRYARQAVALLALAGGFATPLLLGGAQQPWFVLSYALLLDVGALLAAKRRAWRWPEAVALAGTVVLYLNQAPPQPFYALFVVAWFAVFAAS